MRTPLTGKKPSLTLAAAVAAALVLVGGCANTVSTASPDASDDDGDEDIDGGVTPITDADPEEDADGTGSADDTDGSGPSTDADAGGDDTDATAPVDASDADTVDSPDDADGSGTNSGCTGPDDCTDTEVCIDGLCVAKECEGSGAFCEDATTAAVCTESGSVTDRVDCAGLSGCDVATCGCEDGECVIEGPCTADALYCSGSDVFVCGDDGQGGRLVERCDVASGFACADGACVCGAAVPDTCGDRCTALASDPSNCGTCGTECTAGQICQSGSCVCPVGTTNCGGACVDIQTSDNHCGACNRLCGIEQSCEGGICACDDKSQLACGTRCLNGQTDVANCGACGNICATDQTCTEGSCACFDPSETVCNRSCVDVQTSTTNCGTCGNACPAFVACVDGVCRCPAGLLLCDGECVDPDEDESHCGGCNQPCGGECNSGVCNAAACTCPGTFLIFPYVACDPRSCPGGEPCCMPSFPGCLAVSDDELRRPCVGP